MILSFDNVFKVVVGEQHMPLCTIASGGRSRRGLAVMLVPSILMDSRPRNRQPQDNRLCNYMAHITQHFFVSNMCLSTLHLFGVDSACWLFLN